MKLRNVEIAEEFTFLPNDRAPWQRKSQWRSVPAYIALFAIFAAIGVMFGLGF